MICLAFFSEAFFDEERIELMWHLYKKIGVNVSFNLKCIKLAPATQVRFGRYAVFRKACLPNIGVYTYFEVPEIA